MELKLNVSFTFNNLSVRKFRITSHPLKLSRFICQKYDVAVIGGGIIGTAIAKTIKKNVKQAKVALIEKGEDLGQHQSSHNSQVIHAGLYYRPNSLKAKLCVEGVNLIYDYCMLKNIPFKKYGKLIVSSNILDNYRLNVLYKRGLENKVSGLELLNNWKDISDIQPHCRGMQALWSPNSGNVDWKTVTKSFGKDFEQERGSLFFNCEVKSIRESADPLYPIIVTDAKNETVILAKYIIICLGLHSGGLFNSQENNNYTNISLRVNYYLLNPRLRRFIKTNIYGMPHLDMPFLGIHISPTVDGKVLLGPSALPALQLDGYKRNDIDLFYIQNHVCSKSFGRLFIKNFWSCLSQLTETVFEDVRTSALSKYFPMLSKTDVLPGPTAVQGQVVTSEGEFVDDFLIDMFQGKGIGKRIVNCKFIPSPGATSSLAIANMISSEMVKRVA